MATKEQALRLVIGLGNPGDRFMNNRRNIGFKVVDVLANNTNIHIKTKKKKSLLGTGDFEGHEIVLLKPQTFMELSGEAVLYIASFHRVPVEKIIVIHDDYTIPYGKVKVGRGEVEIDHKGIKSIAKNLRSDKFVRIRVGIGPIPDKDPDKLTQKDIDKHLLDDFHMEDNMRIIEVINDAEAALRAILTQDIEDVLSRNKLGDPEA